MTEERDPRLESLFDAADQPLADDAFTSAVEAGVKAHRRRILFGRLAIAALLVCVELLLDSPLQDSLGTATDALVTSLVPVRHEWLAFIVAPINSIAGLLGMLLLGLHFVYRKMVY
jgi:hypothetical protein